MFFLLSNTKESFTRGELHIPNHDSTRTHGTGQTAAPQFHLSTGITVGVPLWADPRPHLHSRAQTGPAAGPGEERQRAQRTGVTPTGHTRLGRSAGEAGRRCDVGVRYARALRANCRTPRVLTRLKKMFSGLERLFCVLSIQTDEELVRCIHYFDTGSEHTVHPVFDEKNSEDG